MILKNFVVFEGGDGSGTTTQLDLLKKRFSENIKLPKLYPTFEPTEGTLGVFIRSVLKGEQIIPPKTMAILFAGDRALHLHSNSGILERTQRNELVVCDRYTPSSLVYQGITCGKELPYTLNSHFPLPEMLLFFDIDPEIALKRTEKREIKEIYEYLDFQKKVREEYKTILSEYKEKGVKVTIIDAKKSVEEVAEIVWIEIQKLPIMNYENR